MWLSKADPMTTSKNKTPRSDSCGAYKEAIFIEFFWHVEYEHMSAPLHLSCGGAMVRFTIPRRCSAFFERLTSRLARPELQEASAHDIIRLLDTRQFFPSRRWQRRTRTSQCGKQFSSRARRLSSHSASTTAALTSAQTVRRRSTAEKQD